MLSGLEKIHLHLLARFTLTYSLHFTLYTLRFNTIYTIILSLYLGTNRPYFRTKVAHVSKKQYLCTVIRNGMKSALHVHSEPRKKVLLKSYVSLTQVLPISSRRIVEVEWTRTHLPSAVYGMFRSARKHPKPRRPSERSSAKMISAMHHLSVESASGTNSMRTV